MTETRGTGRTRLSPERKRLYLRLGALVAGTFVLGFLLTMLLFFPGWWGREPIVTVPDMRGRTLAQARRLAGRADLELERGSTLAHPTVRAGAVLAQTPLPGREVTRGSEVRVILSSGPERRPVPDVAQLGGEQASALLRHTGFSVRIRRVSSDRPAGRVLEVRPAAGTPVAVPGAVELVLSAGPPTVAVPAVTGMPEGAAREALASAGLRLGEVSYDPASAAPQGEVVAQSLAPGSSVRNGAAVGITVAGPAPVEVPQPDSVAVTPEPVPPPAPPPAP